MDSELRLQIAREFMLKEAQDVLIERLASLSTRFSLSGKQLAEKWQLFAIPRNLSVIGNGGPTLEHLDEFQENLQNPVIVTPKKPTHFVSTPSRSNKRPPGTGQTFDMTKFEHDLDASAMPYTETPTRIEFKVERWEGSGDAITTLHPSLPQSTQEPDTLADVTILERYEENQRYMTLNISEAAEILDSMIENRLDPLIQGFQEIQAEESDAMDDKEKPQGFQLQNPSLPHQAPFLSVGRICCSVEDNSTNHLSGGVTLEPARSMVSTMARVPLDLSGVPSFSIFPGQIVGVEGINPAGNEIRASKISKLSFEPLAGLLHSVKNPHMLVLVGPFLSEDHPKIHEGKFIEPVKAFSTYIAPQLLSFKARNPHTHIALVPSTRDVFHPFITLPQPGFVANPGFGLPPALFHLPGNPARFTVNNVEVACLGYDILMAMAKCEISSGASGPRLARLADHLLQSASLFPLYPSPDDLCFDVNLPTIESFALPHLPHILVTPSSLQPFAHVIGGGSVVGINPGRLTAVDRGGTYAVINIFPDQPNGLWNPSQCRVDIVRV
ncbi:DNA polymerase alpha subunit B [Massospora cicadina]|nr:DNA polymerase alpha subunit B [Massospora cicadina]